MSLVICDKCGDVIDSDDDPECFIPPSDGALCQSCRESIEEEPMGQSINSILTLLDTYMAMANDPGSAHLIAKEAIGIGQILSRAQLILSFLDARKPPKFTVVPRA